MKSDLDELMQSAGLDALLVMGAAVQNPPMVYLTGGALLTWADLIKERGRPGLLFHGPMERDEAAKTGLSTRSYSAYSDAELLRQADGDRVVAMALRYQRMLADAGLTSGRVALYGSLEIGGLWDTLAALQKLMPELVLVGDSRAPVLREARATKDAREIERIRHMGQVTVQVVAETADFLCSHEVKAGVLVHADGSPLTVGEVKSRINLWLAERGAENPEGTIFAIGREGAVPHSTGRDDDLLRLGQTIVFDIFPCEAGGGYFYDFTRTWCLGYAPDEALELHEQVLQVYRQVAGELRVDQPGVSYQRRVCELFESMGHATIQTDPQTEHGYVHSLGHGVGLNVQEAPWLSIYRAGPKDILAPGSVFTIEPGLYYPERGLGARLEDTYWVDPHGKIEPLVDYPMDLILPLDH